MKRSRTWGLFVTVLALAVGLGLAGSPLGAQSPTVLAAKKVSAAPPLEPALAGAWTSAPELVVSLRGGRNLPEGRTEARLRALYTADTIYFLIQYKDPTESVRRGPWVKQADGTWQKLRDPNDKGGDNNLYYEDKMALIWNISSPAFEAKGCMSACHIGEGKPFGNKYTASAGERLDMWHWKGVRTGPTGQIDDQYVDGTRYDKDKSPNAGRKSDPKSGGGYADNVSDAKKGPKFGLKGNRPAPPYWIMDADKEPLDDSRYKAGNEVPGILVAPFTGDRGDIAAKDAWKNGVRTIVIARKLVTGSEFDVQFDDLKKPYAFGVSVFDNAQVRHAYSLGVLKLVFE
jgi:hypothetical protein